MAEPAFRTSSNRQNNEVQEQAEEERTKSFPIETPIEQNDQPSLHSIRLQQPIAIRKGDSDAEKKHQKIDSSRPANIHVESPTTSLPEKSRKNKIHRHSATEADFFKWCQQVLGIQTMLEVQTFEYYDFYKVAMQEVEEEEDSGVYTGDDDAFYSPSVDDFPMIQVRGLAAAQNIEAGDVVISIPFHAIITVFTTIDHDPVLSQLMGPQARAAYGWDDSYYELPLLTVAILYHRRLERASPLYHYLQILLTSPVDTMPFLWDRETLRKEATEGVQRIARGIKRDVREMYDAVMSVLIANHPQVFSEEGKKPEEKEWMYSFEMFQWGFAMVNSRHWHLPIKELDHGPTASPSSEKNEHVAMSPTVTAGVPPAETPTEEWVREQDNADSKENTTADEGKSVGPDNTVADSSVNMEGAPQEERQGHSFLAPVADLLNFGPPCIRGTYNSDTKRFELIATCDYTKGQEVTFWYSDDCEDAIIANYGFTHPVVPKCMSLKDWRHQSDLWKRHAETMEKDLLEAYEDLDRLDTELKNTQSVLDSCRDCDIDDDYIERRGTRARASRDSRDDRHARLRRETGVRGGVRYISHAERGSERRKWQRSIKSSL